MQIDATAQDTLKTGNTCRVVAVFADSKLKGGAQKIDRISGGAIKRAMQRGDFAASIGQTLLLNELSDVAATRVLLLGLGDSSALNRAKWLKAVEAMAAALLATGTTHAITDMVNAIAVADTSVSWRAGQVARVLESDSYRFAANKTKQLSNPPVLEHMRIVVKKASLKEATETIKRGVATAHGMARTRDLGNLPPNICTPLYLANIARDMAEQYESLNTRVLDEDAMRDLSMGALLAVSSGSEQPAQLIAMEYQGRKRKGSPIVLVGKGVTFDTGGISIKGSEGMDEMKYDMCGAATVFGVIEACCQLDLNINVVGVVAAAENMPDGKAYRPGDIVTSMSGQTIEIMNTDAEGRLVLADALTWVEHYNPAAIIDIATLTGACITALGHVSSAVFGNNQPLVEELLAAGKTAGDPAWQLPLWHEYQQQLDSNFADMANIGGRPAGSITAACFLSRFVEKNKWAHLDIAGTAWRSGKEKGASGRPVPLIMHFLFNRIA